MVPLLSIFRKKWLRYGLSAALMVFLLSQLSFDEMSATLRRTQPEQVLVALLAGLGLMAFSGYRWSWLVDRSLGIPSLTFIRLTFISAFTGLFLPGTIGTEAVRVIGLSRSIGAVRATASVVVDRVLSLFAQILLALAMMALLPVELRAGLAAWGVAGLAALLAIAALVMNRAMRRLVLRLLSPGWLSRVRSAAEQVFAALEIYRSSRLIGIALILALLLQILRAVFLWTCALAFDVDITIGQFLIALPVVSLIEMVPITFAGVGTRDAAFAVVLAQFGIPPEVSVPVSLLAFLLGTVAASLPGAVLWLGFAGPRARPPAP